MASSDKDLLVGSLAGQTIGDGLHVLPGQGNSLAIETDAGIVIIDVSTPRHFDKMIGCPRDSTDAAIHAIVYSHGHHGYNSALDLWQAHNAERGDEPPRVVAHRNLPARYELCAARSAQVAPFVSKSCYESSARLLEGGSRSCTSQR